VYHLSAKIVPQPNLQCTREYSLFQIDQKSVGLICIRYERFSSCATMQMKKLY